MKIPPKTLGACVDKLYSVTQKRLDIQRECEAKVESLKRAEQELREHILTSFGKAQIDGAKGSVATAAVTRTVVPTVVDWPALYSYIRKTDSFELLERRVSSVAYREHLESDKEVPGVDPFVKVGLSLNKVRKDK